MLDLEGNELEVGTYYILPSNTQSLCICVFSHETANSYMFKTIWKSSNVKYRLYSWRRQIAKYANHTNIPVIKASVTLLNQLGLQ